MKNFFFRFIDFLQSDGESVYENLRSKSSATPAPTETVGEGSEHPDTDDMPDDSDEDESPKKMKKKNPVYNQ